MLQGQMLLHICREERQNHWSSSHHYRKIFWVADAFPDDIEDLLTDEIDDLDYVVGSDIESEDDLEYLNI